MLSTKRYVVFSFSSQFDLIEGGGGGWGDSLPSQKLGRTEVASELSYNWPHKG